MKDSMYDEWIFSTLSQWQDHVVYPFSKSSVRFTILEKETISLVPGGLSS